MRNKINPNAVCSSKNYVKSKKVHREYIRRFHRENTLEIEKITESIVVSKKYYVSCFGRLVEISEQEARKVRKSIKVIIK